MTPTPSSKLSTVKVIPLGAGGEVGRSCILVKYRDKSVMFDCGIHPGKTGTASLPIFETTNLSAVQLCLITHFHLDHCGALPYLMCHTSFKGRVFMTAPTKAICYLLWRDYIRVTSTDSGRSALKSSISKKAAVDGSTLSRSFLYNREDIEATMANIETINFRETLIVDGVEITPLSAGHVIGACMFGVSILGARVLYTGDFSSEVDRHVPPAELPQERPDVVICESTFGTRVHENRAEREKIFLDLVTETVFAKKGKLLLPVFALGRAQELLLMLEEHWQRTPELHSIPIIYISPLANKALATYQAAGSYAGQSVRRLGDFGIDAYKFEHIIMAENSRECKSTLSDVSQPCVVLCSPGMLQSGASRKLFEEFAPHPNYGVILTGYSVKGTLAESLRSSPGMVTLDDQMIKVRCSVNVLSFSAHSDFPQTRAFLEHCQCKHVILVHGEKSEGVRMQNRLRELYPSMCVYTPENCKPVLVSIRTPQQVSILSADVVERIYQMQYEQMCNQIDGIEKLTYTNLNRPNNGVLNDVVISVDDSSKITLKEVHSDASQNVVSHTRMTTIPDDVLKLTLSTLGPIADICADCTVEDTDTHLFSLDGIIQFSLIKGELSISWQASDDNNVLGEACIYILDKVMNSPVTSENVEAN